MLKIIMMLITTMMMMMMMMMMILITVPMINQTYLTSAGLLGIMAQSQGEALQFPAALFWRPQDLAAAKANVEAFLQRVAEGAEPPLTGDVTVTYTVECNCGVEIVGITVHWHPVDGFFIGGPRGDIPLVVPGSGAVQAEFFLTDFLRAQRCLDMAPRSASTVSIPSSSGDVVVDRACNLTIRFLSGKELSIKAASSNTIEDVKMKIQRLSGIPAAQQQLIFAGKPLEEERTLSDYNVPAEATLDLMAKLPRRK
jgi:hypothetical protein